MTLLKTFSADRPVVVTGGCGFIGSAVVRHLVRGAHHPVVNVDKLTYAGHPSTVVSVANDPLYAFERADIADARAMGHLFEVCRPAGVLHLAAESHVDRSIHGPAAFIETNVVGTYTLLHAALAYWRGLPAEEQDAFRFLHVSTDEVYGALGDEGVFTEDTPYDPHSPYSASKASSDHLVRAWHHTYGLPVLVTNCSNNYGPFQYPEKLIPVVIRKALAEERIPVYGRGANVRDWLHVDDHVHALRAVLTRGRPGHTYLIGTRNERRNLELVQMICGILDEIRPRQRGSHADLIAFVDDRPGHDWRYAVDPSKLERDTGWRPAVDFADGLRQTVAWYVDNTDWCETVLDS
jgi:dTDP-glucose 4,6-dehydratase